MQLRQSVYRGPFVKDGATYENCTINIDPSDDRAYRAFFWNDADRAADGSIDINDSQQVWAGSVTGIMENVRQYDAS